MTKDKSSKPEEITATADALYSIANQLNRLGIGNAGTDEGAIEVLAKSIKDGLESVATSIDGLASAVESLAEKE
ncbi:hypothetical protein [Maridesulfovibrio ferrireducens]|uniref:hypothetical protein n=1 Tax=Maridesulfovibrio ferrireducens TaxID=246191 RepID=UPI001A188F5C|nr:hypothetical protein [Maridesulfovibrio ferrireducens]MBI9112230.1 hypothetical protein [Maridesulfovibrio ferrireducens]